MKNTTLALMAVVSIVLSGFIFFSDTSGIAKVLLIWAALSVPGTLLIAKIFPKRGH